MGIEDRHFSGFVDDAQPGRSEAARREEIERIKRDGTLHGPGGSIAIKGAMTDPTEGEPPVGQTEVVVVEDDTL